MDPAVRVRARCGDVPPSGRQGGTTCGGRQRLGNEHLRHRRQRRILPRDFRPRFELLFPHPTPEVRERHGDALDHLERWLDRGKSDHSIPSTIPTAIDAVNASVAVLGAAKTLLPADEFATRLVVDTNVLLDNADLAQFMPQLGGLDHRHTDAAHQQRGSRSTVALLARTTE
jgi:hypothetical protein